MRRHADHYRHCRRSAGISVHRTSKACLTPNRPNDFLWGCSRALLLAATSLRWRYNGRLKSPASPLFTQRFIQSQIKENIKAPRHWSLCGEFPAQMVSNAENNSISWRHHYWWWNAEKGRRLTIERVSKVDRCNFTPLWNDPPCVVVRLFKTIIPFHEEGLLVYFMYILDNLDRRDHLRSISLLPNGL